MEDLSNDESICRGGSLEVSLRLFLNAVRKSSGNPNLIASRKECSMKWLHCLCRETYQSIIFFLLAHEIILTVWHSENSSRLILARILRGLQLITTVMYEWNVFWNPPVLCVDTVNASNCRYGAVWCSGVASNIPCSLQHCEMLYFLHLLLIKVYN